MTRRRLNGRVLRELKIFSQHAYQPRVLFEKTEAMDVGRREDFVYHKRRNVGFCLARAWKACVYEMRIRPTEMIPMLWFKENN